MLKHLLLALCIPLSIASVLAQKTLAWDVYFDYDKSIIRASEEPTLKKVTDSLSNIPNVTIYLRGNTDADGSDQYNQALSEHRTRAVQDYLVAKGIDIQRFAPVSNGEKLPIADNVTTDGKQKNRRVEIFAVFTPPSRLSRDVPSVSKVSEPKKAVQKAPEKPKIPQITMTDFLVKETANDMQTYKITVSKTEQSNIVAQQGTILSFPPDAFEVAEGTELTVSLREAYSMSDIFFQNLATHADDDEMLVTGGMIYIDVQTKEGKKVSPKKKYKLMMPRQKKETLPFDKGDFKQARINPVQLWTANGTSNNNMTWGVPKQASFGIYNKLDRLTKALDTAQRYHDWIRDTCDCDKMFVWRKDSAYSVKQTNGKVVKEKETFYEIADARPKGYRFSSLNPDAKFSRLCKHIANWAVENNMQGADWQTLHWMQENSDFKGENAYETFDISKLKESKQRKKTKQSFFQKLFGIKEKKEPQMSKIVAFGQLQRSAFLELSYMKSLKAAWEEEEVRYRQMMADLKIDAKTLAEIEKAQYTIFETQELGNINCDYFAKMKEEILVSVKTNLQSSPFNMAKMIFKNRKVVMNANMSDGKTVGFGNIPKGEDVVIVAMKIENGQSYLAMQSVKVDNKQYNLAFEPLSAEKVRERLKMLD